MVSGSSIYKVKISIGEMRKKQWSSICNDCAGGIDSLVELLQGRLSKGVMERICRQDSGLFPKPAEIRFSCSCPDYVSMCKHVAAVLYGVGARLDEQPGLLFRLRAVNEEDLVAHINAALPTATQVPAPNKVLDIADPSALFGLDMEGAERAATVSDGGPPAQQKPARAKRGAQVKPSDVKQTAVMKKDVEPSVHNKAGSGAMSRRDATRKPLQKRVPPKLHKKMKAGRIARKAATTDA